MLPSPLRAMGMGGVNSGGGMRCGRFPFGLSDPLFLAPQEGGGGGDVFGGTGRD
jgi:hypothetical protein